MGIKFKNSISLFLMVLFFIPSVIKMEHHHDYFKNKINTESHSSDIQKQCPICKFELPAFSSSLEKNRLQMEVPSSRSCNNYCSIFYSIHSEFSFLLRGPPVAWFNSHSLLRSFKSSNIYKRIKWRKSFYCCLEYYFLFQQLHLQININMPFPKKRACQEKLQIRSPASRCPE